MKVKLASLGILSFVTQSIIWIWLKHAFTNHASPSEWIWLSVFVAFSIVLTSFFFLVSHNRLISGALIVASLIVYILVSPIDVWVITGGILFALLSWMYEYRLQKEYEGRSDFRLTRVISSTVSIIIYGLLILFGLNIYHSVAISFRNNPDQFYNQLGEKAAHTVPYFSKTLPADINVDQPLDQYLAAEAPQQAPQVEKQKYIANAKKAFEDEFKITAKGNETVSDLIAQVAVSRVKQTTEPYQKYLPLIFTIIIVGLMYTFMFLIRWVILILAWISFRVLLAIGFFKLTKVQIEVEKLTI